MAFLGCSGRGLWLLSSAQEQFRSGQEPGGAFSAKVLPEDPHQQEQPALLEGPLLRSPGQTADFPADGLDRGSNYPGFFMQDAHPDVLLSPAFHPPAYALHQGGSAGERFAVVGFIVKPDIQVPPVVDHGNKGGHDAAGGDFLCRIPTPSPLVFGFVNDVMPAVLKDNGWLSPLRSGSASARPR